MPQEALNLPWQTQLVLVAGYFGYIVAYSGRRNSHESIDIFAIIMCFGSIALLVLSSQSWIKQIFPNIPIQLIGIFAILCSIVAAAVWRSFARNLTHQGIRILSRSDDDGMKTAWESITQIQGFAYSQLNVTLTDGRVFESYPLVKFNSWPNGPCIFGGDGAIGMYVTHIYENEQRREAIDLETADGMRMTFIASERIQEVDFTRQKKESGEKLTFFRRRLLGRH